MTDTRRRLLIIIQGYPDLTQQALARRADISERTARRHLGDLVNDGLVLVHRDGTARRYHLAAHAYPVAPAPEFNEGEMEALAVAALAARHLLAPTPLAVTLDSAAEKLRTDWLQRAISFEVENEARLWSFDGATGGQAPAADPTLFRNLLGAVRHQNPIRADYYTASRDAFTADRHLAPLGFLVRNGAWLVAAIDLDAPATDDGSAPVKDFALAGFRRVERLEDQHTLRPEGFDLTLYARDRFGAIDGEVEEVRLLVEPEAVPAFRRKLYNPTQQIEEVREDGRAVVSFEAGGMEAVKAWCLSWGPKVKVLAPESLADQVVESHHAAAAHYGST